MSRRFDQGGAWGAALVGLAGLALIWVGLRLNSPETVPKSQSELDW